MNDLQRKYSVPAVGIGALRHHTQGKPQIDNPEPGWYYALKMRSAIEIMLKDDVQRIFDEFSACFNMSIGFFSPTGEELAVGLKKPESEFCTLVRESLKKKDECLTFDSEKRWRER